MRFTDRSGGVPRRRVIIHFPEQIAPAERDPHLKDKIARTLLQSQQNSDEALSIKRDADPAFDFCGYLEALPDADGMYMGNANIVPRQPRVCLYHAYLVYMEAHGYKNMLSLTMFGKELSAMLKEYGLNYDKRRTNHGMQTNLTLREESNADWLPKCDEPTAT
jgi:putative DNA primase/helicase